MKNFKSIVVALILTGILVSISAAQSPVLVNYQGYLTDADGKALSGNHQIIFLLYDRMDGGDPLWQETHTVTVDKGLFNVLLGSVDSTLGRTHFTGERFLAIKIGTDNEQKPRMRLASVTHSLLADQADGAYTLDAPNNGPEDVVFVAETGEVGIGKTDPQSAMDVNGDLLADNMMVKVFEESFANKSFFEIPNLNGNVHKVYKIYFQGTLHLADTYLLIGPNADETAGNYYSLLNHHGNADGWNSFTVGYVIGRSWVGECLLSAEYTLFAEAGKGRFGTGHGIMWYNLSYHTLVYETFGRWADINTNINSLRFTVKNINGVPAGTFSGRIIVYATDIR